MTAVQVTPLNRSRPTVRTFVAAIAATLLVASVLVFVAAKPAAAAPPMPTVGLSLDDQPFIGAQVDMELTFSNPTPADTGYGPFTDLFLPTNGADGTSGGGPRDGISFLAATYLGAPAISSVLTLACDGSDVHPLTGQAVTCPPGFTAGDTMTTITLPFGSFTPTQPAATVLVTAQLSNFADLGVALGVAARAGFRYGADPIDNPLVDPPIVSPTLTTSSVTPTLITIEKESNAPESETATGENFPRSWTVSVEIAPGQTVTDLRVTDSLPDEIAYGGVSGISPAGSVTDEPAGAGPWSGESVTVSYPTVTSHAAYDLAFHVPELDASSAPVIDPTSGAPTPVDNDAAAVGNWTPLDPRDPAGVDNAVADPPGPLDTVTARSLATQKDVVVSTDTGRGGPTPGDTLTWTIQVQISDYFDVANLALADVASDGQHLDTTFDPSITFNTPDGSGSALLGGYFTSDTNGPTSPGGCNAGDPGAITIGVDLAGFLNSTAPSSGGVWFGDAAGGTTATITYRTVIDSAYRCDFGGSAVNTRDDISNRVAASGQIPGGGAVSDSSSEEVTIVAPAATKEVYAINGDTADTGPDIASGDLVTYRIRASAPLTNILDLSITDYLPLPTFEIPSTPSPFTNLTGSGPVPPGPFSPTAWTVALGPSDTFSSTTGLTPTVTSDVAGNSVTLTYPDFQSAPGSSSEALDLLITVEANDQPFADGLLLTNQARMMTANSPSVIASTDAIVQVTLTEPELTITKGVVTSDGPSASYSPASTGPAGVSWSAPGTPGVRFSGAALTSATLATSPIASDVSRVDAGDTVTFALVVDNVGSGIRGAFDVAVGDVVPAGLVEPSGGWNITVSDGNGTPLAHTGTDPSSIALIDPAVDQGALAPYSPNAATNVAVITFDATLASSVEMNQLMSNVAEVTNYSGSEGGPNFVVQPVEDTATVRAAIPSITKTVTATGAGVPPSAPPNLEVPIGSVATYRVVVTVPEGVTPNFELRDTLDAGLAFVSFDSIAASPALSTSYPGGFSAALAATNVTGSGTVATVPLSTITNSDTDNSTPETLTLDYTVVLLNSTGNTTGASRNNSVIARAGGSNLGTAVSAPDLRVNEPSLSVSKSATPTTADAGDTIDYTITLDASSATRTSTAHDVTLTDTLPDGVTYVPGSFAFVSGAVPSSVDPVTQTATWTTLAPGATATFTLSAVVDDDATSFGAAVTNTARATYSSLPGPQGSSLSPYNSLGVQRTGSTSDIGGSANTYNRTGQASVTVNASDIDKSLSSTSAPHTSSNDVTIGETATFTLDVTLPEGDLGTVTVTDLLPAGLVYLPGSASLDATGFAGTWSGSPSLPAAQMSGNNVNFVFEDMVVASGPGSTDNTLHVTLTARVADVAGNTAGTTLTNTARVTVGGSQFNSNGVPLDVVVPALTVLKSFTPGSAAANDTVSVALTVTNSGTSTAFDTVVTDLVDGDVFTDVIPVAPAGWTATAVPQGGDTLVTFTADPHNGIAPSGSQALTFTAKLVADAPAPSTQPNTANSSASTLDGTDSGERTVTGSGSDTLDVTGVDIAVEKTADVTTADAGDTITYTITVRNLGGRDADGVVLTDTLGDHIASFSASGSYTTAGSTMTWDPFPLAAGASTTRTVTATVVNPLPVGATLTTNNAEAADDGTHGSDLDPSDNSDDASVSLGSVVDLATTKTGPADAAAGATITYQVNVENLGDRNAADATVTDTLGEDLTFVSATGGGTYDAGTRTITWSGVDLTGAAGSTPSVDFTVTATVSNPMPAGHLTVVNDASVSHPDDVNPLNDDDTVTTSIDAEVDLVITKDDHRTTVVPGDAATYDVSVTNVGTRGASGVTVTDALDPNLEFVSATGAATYDPGTHTVSWTLGTVEVGDVVDLSVSVTVSDPLAPLSTTSITNTVTVDDDGSNGPEHNPADNTASDTDTTGADVTVTKDLGSPQLVPGAAATYTITVSNAGPMTVADISVNDTMPSDLTVTSLTVDRGTIDDATWLWSDVNLAAGQTATLTVVVDVSLDATGDRTNTVTVTGVDVGDPNPGDNTAATTDPIVPTADLGLTKSLDGHLVRGQTATWRLEVTNNGPSRATDVVVTDTLPLGLALVSAVGDDGAVWSCTSSDARTVSCRLDRTMEPADTATLLVGTTVAPDAPAGTITNTASVSAAETEVTTANNAAVSAGVLEALPAPATPSRESSGDATSAPPSLAYTGSNPQRLVLVGIGGVMIGFLLLLLRRRRR